MNDEEYRAYCKTLLADFADTFMTRLGVVPGDHPLRTLASRFASLTSTPDDVYALGPPLIARLFDSFPAFAPTFPRQLLWFFGGECLHYMTDEEIVQFQQLEEMRASALQAGESFDLARATNRLFTLH